MHLPSLLHYLLSNVPHVLQVLSSFTPTCSVDFLAVFLGNHSSSLYLRLSWSAAFHPSLWLHSNTGTNACIEAYSCQASKIVKNLPAMWKTQIWSLGQEDPLEKGMATHSSILAWRIPWTEEPGGQQSMGLQRGRHNLETNTFTFHCMKSLEKWKVVS